jgi:hypothetical protein
VTVDRSFVAIEVGVGHRTRNDLSSPGVDTLVVKGGISGRNERSGRLENMNGIEQFLKRRPVDEHRVLP